MNLDTIFIIAAVIFVIWIIRELQTWYWKIDERIKIQNEQTELLSQMLSELKKLGVETIEEPKTEAQ